MTPYACPFPKLQASSPLTNQQPNLLDHFREALCSRHYSRRTEQGRRESCRPAMREFAGVLYRKLDKTPDKWSRFCNNMNLLELQLLRLFRLACNNRPSGLDIRFLTRNYIRPSWAGVPIEEWHHGRGRFDV